MTVRAEVENGQLADLVKQVETGNEVLLIQGNKLVAKLVPVTESEVHTASELRIRSFKGHRVLIAGISQAELAEEMFGRSF